ncbi:sulfurtransferase [Pseudalkalibacillus caeni]|uniref:Sulfurtransferase n=1 Tax=Exobacillus caeni TaxID=2574798 RepID=A0A5R9F4N7_9BACL|nr:sulfurtransferase [Pseudalkalibacillus caeni]TLS37459.1 sulfurtransferase [Pseudalkalibacillus caeni]
MTDILVSASWLSNHVNDPDLVIADCRFNLANKEEGIEEYTKEHIPNAVYLDLEKDLSGMVKEHGGRHPLPDLEQFAQLLGNKGINKSKLVVAYDDQGGAMAARLWWMLRFLGHKRTAILDGGFSGWQKQGFPVTNEIPSPEKLLFEPVINREAIIPMEEIKKMAGGSGLLIDSRAPERYKGEEEPIDPKAGHIPGAINYFWKDNIKGSQSWKTRDELQKQLSFLEDDQNAVVYCGSGVTACANLFAFHLAGFDHVKLYPGSWSDWISYPENEVETN